MKRTHKISTTSDKYIINIKNDGVKYDVVSIVEHAEKKTIVTDYHDATVKFGMIIRELGQKTVEVKDLVIITKNTEKIFKGKFTCKEFKVHKHGETKRHLTCTKM